MCDGAIKVEEELGLNPLYETRIPRTHSTIPRLTSIKGVAWRCSCFRLLTELGDFPSPVQFRNCTNVIRRRDPLGSLRM